MLKLLKVYKHPEMGNIVITDIEFIGDNPFRYFYEWRKVLGNGEVSREKNNGVAGIWREVPAEVTITVKLKDNN